MMSFLVRFVIVLISLVLSCVACATVFFAMKKLGEGADPLTIDLQVFLYAVGNTLLDGIKLSFRIGPEYILGPALAVILTSFLLRIRTLLYYIPAGGLAALAIPVLTRYAQGTGYQQPDENSILLYLVSGAAAGFVYWVIGGANAVPKRGVSFF